MKKIKMSLSMLLIAVLMLTTQVSAASGINAHEQRVLDALKQSVTTTAGTLTLPAKYVNQANTYLQRDGVDLTEAQADEIITKINQVVGLLKATNAKSWKEVPQDVVDRVVKLAQEAATIVGLTLSFDAATGVVTIKDASGTTVVTTDKVVKQTGYSLNAVWVGCLAVAAILVVATLVLKKKKISNVEG